MKKIKYTVTFLLILIATLSFSQSDKVTNNSETETTRILFIGNSYFYFNSVSQLVKSMAKDKFPNRKVETKMISQGGMTLKRHWQDGKALDEIKKDKWDYVVLQEQSSLGTAVYIDYKSYFDKAEMFFEYVRNFDAEIRKIDAKTVLFMTWSKKDSPEQQKYLTYAYTTIAKELNSLIAPVGLVWDKQRNNQAFDLYYSDGAHPSVYGSYLVATTLFTTIFETNPVGISGKIEGYRLASTGQRSKEIQPLTDIAKADATAIQTSTWDIINSLRETNGYMEIPKPEQGYTIPVLPKGKNITKNNIVGRWYGTTRYGYNSIGVILDIKYSDGKWDVNISLFKPDQADHIEVENIKIVADKLSFNVKEDRQMESEVNFVLNENALLGVSKTNDGDYTYYNNWQLSRDKVQNSIDLEAVSKVMESLDANIKELGFVKATLNHYEQYSKLTGANYKPEEAALNWKGYGLLRDKKFEQALNVFELAVALYPESANTYDSFGESLVAAGQKEKALKMFTKAYNVAKKTNDENLAYFEKNMNDLKKELG